MRTVVAISALVLFCTMGSASIDCCSADDDLLWPRCVVTKSSYTDGEDFQQADAIYDCIGDRGDERFTFEDLVQILQQSGK